MNKKVKNPSINRKVVLIATGSFVVLILVVSLYLSFNKFGTATNGTIGDAFNGLLAPFISFAGALLVYLSFRQQIEANKLISDQWQFDTFILLYNDIEGKLNRLVVIGNENMTGTTGKTKEYVGMEFIKYWATYMTTNFSGTEIRVLDTITFMIDDINTYIDLVTEAKIPQTDFFLKRMKRFYISRLENVLKELHTNTEKHPSAFTEFRASYNILLENMTKI